MSDSLVSTQMIGSTNMIVQLPYLPVVLYGDVGVFENNGSMDMAYGFGAGVRFGETFGVYFPIVESNNMFDSSTKYWNRIRFTLNLNGIKPAEIIQGAL